MFGAFSKSQDKPSQDAESLLKHTETDDVLAALRLATRVAEAIRDNTLPAKYSRDDLKKQMLSVLSLVAIKARHQFPDQSAGFPVKFRPEACLRFWNLD